MTAASSRQSPVADIAALDLAHVAHIRASAPGEKMIKAALVAGLHLILIVALAAVAVRPQLETLLTRLEVKVIEEPPPPPVEKAKPLPMAPKAVVRPRPEPAPQPPVLESVAPAAPVTIAPPPPPVVAPAREAAAPPPPPPPAPVTAARFDADYLRNPPPAYPALSRRMGEQGQVMLRVLVTRDGAAKTVELHRSSGFGRLDEAALDAVRHWRFVPARRGAEAIEDWVLVPIVFRLAK